MLAHEMLVQDALLKPEVNDSVYVPECVFQGALVTGGNTCSALLFHDCV